MQTTCVYLPTVMIIHLNDLPVRGENPRASEKRVLRTSIFDAASENRLQRYLNRTSVVSAKEHLTLRNTRHTRQITLERAMCSKTLSAGGHMTVHMRCHAGETPFEGAECSKAFTLSSSLIRHIRGTWVKNRSSVSGIPKPSQPAVT